MACALPDGNWINWTKKHRNKLTSNLSIDCSVFVEKSDIDLWKIDRKKTLVVNFFSASSTYKNILGWFLKPGNHIDCRKRSIVRLCEARKILVDKMLWNVAPNSFDVNWLRMVSSLKTTWKNLHRNINWKDENKNFHSSRYLFERFSRSFEVTLEWYCLNFSSNFNIKT